MSSILNSISSGELQVQQVPEVKPVKEDSIVDLLQNPEIEFETCLKPDDNLKDSIVDLLQNAEIEIEFEIYPKPDDNLEDSIIDSSQNTEIEFETCPKFDNNLEDFNTGFGANNDVHFKDICKKPDLKVPLYKENYLSEFKEETEKTIARENLDVYSKLDVNRIVSEIIANDTSTFITVEGVEKMLEELDFVDSTLRAKVNYDIPENLFKL